MSEKFKKLKAKYLLGAILKSVVCGISAGLVLVGVLLLVFKLSATSLDTLWYILIGIGGVLIGGGVAFAFFRPTDKNVAARLDNEFGLEERVQTSLAYSGQDGAILQLQREDTEDKLQTLPKSKFRFSRVWQFCMIALIAVAVAVTAFVVPAKEAGASGPVDPDEEVDEVTVYQVQSVQDIINNVNKSGLSEELKIPVVEDLTVLLDRLTLALNGTQPIKTGEKRNALYATINGVELTINSSLSYPALAEAFAADGYTNISQAVLAGGNTYRTYDIKEYGHVVTFDTQRGDAVPIRVAGGIDAVQEELSVTIEDGLADIMLNMGYNAVITLSGSGVAATDTLYGSLNYFFSQLVTLSLNVGEDDAVIQSQIKDSVNTLKNGLGTELSNQSYAGAMRKYISNRLKIVFGLGGVEEAEDDDTKYGNNEETPGNNDEQKPNNDETGGGGTHIFGSDDEIYNPETSKRELYKDLALKYNAILEELKTNGDFTEEQLAMINTYFDYLFGILSGEQE